MNVQSQPPSPRVTPPAMDPPGSAILQENEDAREPDAPTKVAYSDELPDFAKKADDLEAIKQAVDDAASVSGGLWLSYLFVLFYLAVAAGAVTHADLFFEKAVKLPFLGIDLPLVAFFLLAPILFLIVHAYTLVHLVMLTDKAKRYHQALYTQIEDVNGGDRTAQGDARQTQAAAAEQHLHPIPRGPVRFARELIWIAPARDSLDHARRGACAAASGDPDSIPALSRCPRRVDAADRAAL